MSLPARLARLEGMGPGKLLSDADRDAAIARYADAYGTCAAAFPDAMSPIAYRTAISTARDASQQRLLACWLPGDEDL